MRGFIAIGFADFIRDSLGEIMAKLPPAPGIKPVPPRNIHMTLHFLGDIEGKPLERTVELLREIAGETPAFTIDLQNLGQFPARGVPKTLWLGMKASPELRALAEKIKERVPYGDGKPFSPHITLARVRDYGPAEAEAIAAFYKQRTIVFPGQPVGKFALMESILRPKAPEYSIGWEFNLKDGVE